MNGFTRLSLCLAFVSAAAQAEAVTNTFKPVSELMETPESVAILPFSDSILDSLREPDVLNTILDRLTTPIFGSESSTNSFHGLLKGLDIQFKAFNASQPGEDVGLGVEYTFVKSFVGKELRSDPMTPISMSFDVHAFGNVAFDQDRNPDDFLDTGASLHLFGSKGGFEPIADEAEWTAWAATQQERILELSQFEGTEEELDQHPLWRAFEADVQRRLSTQFFWDVKGNFALESNQDFSQKQLAYGLHFGGVIRAWNDDSAWAAFNVFDWPFAALRYLTGADPKGFHPSGQAIPVLLGGIDLVDPVDNDERFAADPDEDAFPRVRFEAAFKTKVARVLNREVWFSASYRYFHELNASSAIRTADLDTFHYFAAALEFLGGFTVTYSTGKLPLDGNDDSVLALGYRFQF